MLILGVRTDKPDAELYLYKNEEMASHKTWQAHRKLAETIHLEIKALLKDAGYGLDDLDAVVVYKGPGSFTGLRIGITVCNTLASGLNLAIVGFEGEDWLLEGLGCIKRGENHEIVLPEYGAPVHITKQKK